MRHQGNFPEHFSIETDMTSIDYRCDGLKELYEEQKKRDVMCCKTHKIR